MDDNLALVQAAAMRLRAGAMEKGLYDNICMSVGLKYDAQGIMWDPRVRPLIAQEVVTIDWVHSLLCDGSFSSESLALLQDSQRLLGKGFAHVSTFLQLGWIFPAQRRHNMRQLHLVFNDFRHAYAENHEKLKASATELLSVYGLLRHWVAVEVSTHASMAMQVASFNACCDILDIIQRAKQGRCTMAEGSRLLMQAASRHLSMHIACYGTGNVKPKHHWVFDVAEQWLEHACVLDAFLIEKEHLRAKQVADRVDNTSQYEISVLSGILHAQVQSLNDLGPQAELLGNAVPYPGFDNALVSDSVTIDGVHLSVGDFIFSDARAAKIIACIQEDGEFLLVVDTLALVARLSSHSGNYAFNGQRKVWNAAVATQALAWREINAGCWTIVLV